MCAAQVVPFTWWKRVVLSPNRSAACALRIVGLVKLPVVVSCCATTRPFKLFWLNIDIVYANPSLNNRIWKSRNLKNFLRFFFALNRCKMHAFSGAVIFSSSPWLLLVYKDILWCLWFVWFFTCIKYICLADKSLLCFGLTRIYAPLAITRPHCNAASGSFVFPPIVVISRSAIGPLKFLLFTVVLQSDPEVRKIIDSCQLTNGFIFCFIVYGG